jgi:hypothetical protein
LKKFNFFRNNNRNGTCININCKNCKQPLNNLNINLNTKTEKSGKLSNDMGESILNLKHSLSNPTEISINANSINITTSTTTNGINSNLLAPNIAKVKLK